ncbi:MAG: DoxX family protein [Bacteroidota bacterium]
MKILYWSSTLLLSLILLWSSYTYVFMKSAIDGVRELGFPDFFRIQLAVLKSIAVVVILVPSIYMSLKEWAYAGVGLFFITAIVAHVAHKDSIIITIVNVLFLGILLTSYLSMRKYLFNF